MFPSLAHADRWVSPDPKKDVRGIQFVPEPPPCGGVVEVDGSANTNEDITRLRVRHSRTHVMVRARFRDLDSSVEQMVTFHIGTDSGPMMLDLWRSQKKDGTFRLWNFLAETPDDPDPEEMGECGFSYGVMGIQCRTSPVLDFETDTATATIPRRCLDDPRWVQVGVESTGFVEGEEGSFTAYYDQWGDEADDSSLIMSPLGARVPAPRGASLYRSAVQAGTIARAHSFEGLRYR